MMVSREFLDNLHKNVNLKELVEQYTELSSVGDNVWGGHCPHPDHEDSTASFRLWLSKDGNWSWSCMGCHCGGKDIQHHNYGSDAIAFVQWMSDYKGTPHKLSFIEAVKKVADFAGLHIESDINNSKYDFLRIQADTYHKNLTPSIRNYLYHRGLDDTDINRWHVGMCAMPEKSSEGAVIKRIVFPLMNKSGNIVGYSKRILPDCKHASAPKYINSANSKWFKKRHFMYGENNIDESFGEIRITEGVMDVILASKYGVKNIVAPLGTAFTEEHAKTIADAGFTPVFCMDGDSAGQKAISRAVRMMSETGVYSKVLILKDGMDMADLANKEQDNLEAYIKQHSLMYWEYLLRDPAAEYMSAMNELKLRIMPFIKEAGKSISNSNEKLLFSDYIAQRFDIHAFM